MDTKVISDFYDNFIQAEQDSGINDRIYSLYIRLLKWGMNPDSNILELGSGIGALTFLLSKYIRKGKIESVDLSPKAVEFAKKRIQGSNILLKTGDAVSFQPSLNKIDFICLFDIIEHIPIERHSELFQNISRISSEHTKVLINIPSPAYIEYCRKTDPAGLQIIDQALALNFIIENLEKNGFTSIYFETYSIWVENDYQFFVAERTKDFKPVHLSSTRSFLQKAIKKMEREWVKMRFNYK
jgi:trans-aconitate 2-methyltransferase